jgi:calcineurin-like phosphoesterase family protein
MSKIWVTSDTHFNHVNILRYCPNRKFASLEAMNESIVADWNAKVALDDVVYFLGDFAMGPKDKHMKFLTRLNGYIKIIPGNHDSFLKKQAELGQLPASVTMLPPIFNLKHGHTYFVLCHFPLDEWEGMAGHSSDHISGSIHLHGHTHGNLKTQRKDRWDIGYDVFGGPVLLDRFVP